MSAPGPLPLVNDWLISNLASFDFAFTGERFRVIVIPAATHRVQMKRLCWSEDGGEMLFICKKKANCSSVGSDCLNMLGLSNTRLPRLPALVL